MVSLLHQPASPRSPRAKAIHHPRRWAALWAATASLLALVALIPVWLFAGLAIYFDAGGTWGGYGSGPREPSSQSYHFQAYTLDVVLALADVLVGFVVYYVRSRRYKRLNAVPTRRSG